MKSVAILKELTFSEILSIALVLTVPFLVLYALAF